MNLNRLKNELMKRLQRLAYFRGVCKLGVFPGYYTGLGKGFYAVFKEKVKEGMVFCHEEAGSVPNDGVTSSHPVIRIKLVVLLLKCVAKI